MLKEIPNRLSNLGRSLSSDQLLQPLGSGERSPKQIFNHLIHFEARSSENIILALLQDEPLIRPIHPERQLGKLLHLDMLPFTDLLTYFTIRRTLLLGLIENLKEDQWSRAVRMEGKQRKESVYLLARSTVLHELEHIEDLENKLNPQ